MSDKPKIKINYIDPKPEPAGISDERIRELASSFPFRSQTDVYQRCDMIRDALAIDRAARPAVGQPTRRRECRRDQVGEGEVFRISNNEKENVYVAGVAVDRCIWHCKQPLTDDRWNECVIVHVIGRMVGERVETAVGRIAEQVIARQHHLSETDVAAIAAACIADGDQTIIDVELYPCP